MAPGTRLAVGWLLAVLLAAGSGWADSEPVAPSLLLVTFDTTRADHIGAYGYANAHTAALDALARRGVLFESALTTTPVTLPSHTSMLTGTYPSAHGIHDNAVFELADDATLVSEVLRHAGWRTGAFVGSYVLDRRYGLDQGFETYRGPAEPVSFTVVAARRPADEVVDDAIAWFSELEPNERFFAWVHFYDPHRPLAAVDAGGGPAERPYDAAISYADAQFGRLRRYLEKRGLDDRLVIIATADHGESNGDHGEGTHGVFLYQSVMRVPLIVAASPRMGWPPGGRRVASAVSNVAIAPTLIALAGLDAREMPSVQVGPLLARDGTLPRGTADAGALYLESFTPFYSYRWRALRAVVRGDHKLIRGVTPELYALADDPTESTDRASEHPELVAELDALLDDGLRRHPPLGWVASRSVSDAESQLLESLGYVTRSASSSDDPFADSLPDPRERIGDLALIDETAKALTRWYEVSASAGSAWQRDQLGKETLEKGRALILQLQTNNPDDPNVPLLLGTIEDESGNAAAAVPLYERALETRPTDATIHARLAGAYAKAGRASDATARMERAISLSPQQSLYYRWLIEHLLGIGEYAAAASWMDRFAAAFGPGTPLGAQQRLWIQTQRERLPDS